jgi:hypothetical protein
MRRMIALALVLIMSSGVAAQTPAPSKPLPVSPAPAAAPVSDLDARTTREHLRQLMERMPPDVGRILKMDPTLLGSESYLAQYPVLAAFLAEHPEVAHNPGFYLEFVQTFGEWEPLDARSETIRMYRNMMESVTIFAVFVTVSGFIAWFVRMFIDYRRWLRLSKVQTEVHNKLLDRFAGTGDLLAYVQSPAGRRFLESTPIALDAGPRQVAAPFGRVLWAVQAGVVITVVGIGFQLVSGRMIEEIGQPMSVIGVLAMSLGVGLVLSGAVSYVLARRLGLVEPPASLERQDSSVT